MKSSILVTGTVLGLLLPGVAHALDCAEIQQRLERVMPAAVGDAAVVEKLLRPRVASPQVSRAFDPARAARAVGDPSLSQKKCCEQCGEGHEPHYAEGATPSAARPPDCTYRGQGGSQLRAKASQGRYVYLNPQRSHRGFTQNDVKQDRAIERTRNALLEFGVPRSEIDLKGVEARDLVLSAQALGPNGELTGEQRRARAEVHVIFPRQVDGTPVFDSFGRAAVDANGDVARLHLNWPDFCIPESARSERLRSRSELIAAAMANIQAAGSCDTVGAVGAMLAYVQVSGLTASSSRPGDEGDATRADSACYVPGVVVSVVGPEELEEEIAIAGQLLAFPLLGDPQGGDTVRQRPEGGSGEGAPSSKAAGTQAQSRAADDRPAS